MSERKWGAAWATRGGALGALGVAGAVWLWPGAPVAVESGPEIVRLHGETSYVPHDAATFDSLATGLAALPEEDLAQMAAFAEALAADLDRHSPDELAGRIGDLLTSVDLAYADARHDRMTAPGYDAEALRGIADRIGYDTEGLTDG